MSTVPALPIVSGRHRNRALAAARRARAVELRADGWTYEGIAAELGYANRGTVHNIVTAALSEQMAEDVAELRLLETARLDALQFALWERAMAGETSAVREIVRIVVSRCRLHGLIGATSVVRDDMSPRTVVVPQGD